MMQKFITIIKIILFLRLGELEYLELIGKAESTYKSRFNRFKLAWGVEILFFFFYIGLSLWESKEPRSNSALLFSEF